jgi:hypothetical protein
MALAPRERSCAAMKIFLSSVIRGFEAYRNAAARAARALRHEVKRAEDFPASSATPQQACLAGVRWAEAVILLLGVRYGDRQASGISPTHEEYRRRANAARFSSLSNEARHTNPPSRSCWGRYGAGRPATILPPSRTPTSFGTR